jgi:hypothetical protein
MGGGGGDAEGGGAVGKIVKMKGQGHESFLQTTELKGSLFTKIIYKNWGGSGEA